MLQQPVDPNKIPNIDTAIGELDRETAKLIHGADFKKGFSDEEKRCLAELGRRRAIHLIAPKVRQRMALDQHRLQQVQNIQDFTLSALLSRLINFVAAQYKQKSKGMPEP